MQVRVLFFGILRDLAGRGGEVLTLPEHATLSDVFMHYEEMNPRLGELAGSIAISVNQEFAGPDSSLKEGDEVAFLPPVSGGLPDQPIDIPSQSRPHASMVREKIDTQVVLTRLSSLRTAPRLFLKASFVTTPEAGVPSI